MIRELRIKNLALIEELTLELEKGFTVFTGETGAGKSILLGAIGLLLGERASSEQIRSGFDEAEIDGVFVLEKVSEPLQALLKEFSIDIDQDELIIRRKISRGDRSKIYVNETPISLAALKKIGDLLVDLHGQHEHQSLLNEDTHIDIIDRLEDIKEIKKLYLDSYSLYAKAKKELEEHDEEMRRLSEKRDLIEFQLKELEQAALKEGEEEELEKEYKLLSSTAQRIESIKSIIEILSPSEGESLVKNISNILRKLEQLSKFDDSVCQWLSDIENAKNLFSELELFCNSYFSGIETEKDPSTRLEEINVRLAKIQRLKKKYNATIGELIELQKKLRDNLQQIENSVSDRQQLEKRVLETKNSAVEIGKKLSKVRKEETAKFDSLITEMMSQLGFKGGKWHTIFIPFEEPTEIGLETAKFYVRTNVGEEELPLAKIVSGGEVSRLMLAVKTILSESDNIPVLIFDEIDTGIGGTVAGKVGKALKELSKNHQVLCISHLHQIASLADNHIKVYKEEMKGRTVTLIKPLSHEERINEIARMLGGDSKIALQHAKELIRAGKN
ncbi:MAG: DNA repair protein RecN [Chitinispirillaceae bacterium]|nr:DNA repair protein RecN [Chitinispirillaceae bacterium]